MGLLQVPLRETSEKVQKDREREREREEERKETNRDDRETAILSYRHTDRKYDKYRLRKVYKKRERDKKKEKE